VLTKDYYRTKKRLRASIGKIAERTFGYERKTPSGTYDGKGIEWAYRKYLNGKTVKFLNKK
jgi:cell division protein FtsI (penicillin-binding protein 3)